MKKTTDELLSELSKSPLSGFLNENEGELSDGELSKYLSELLKEKKYVAGRGDPPLGDLRCLRL